MEKRLLNTISPLGCDAQLKEKHQFTGLRSENILEYGCGSMRVPHKVSTA